MRCIISLNMSKQITLLTMYEYLRELSREEFYNNTSTMLSNWPEEAELFEKSLRQSGLPVYYYNADLCLNLIATRYRSYKYFFNKNGDDIRYVVYCADYNPKLPSRCLIKLYSIINKINFTYTPVAIHLESGKIVVTSRVYTDNDYVSFTAFRNWMRAGDGIIRAFISEVSKDEELMKYITFI